MSGKTTIFANARLPDGALVDIGVEAGRIAAITPAAGAASAAEDFGGALVVPGFVEGHVHLDTSFHGDAWKPHKPCAAGFNVRERVRFQKENMAEAAPMRERARNQLELCLGHGSTRRRSHVMIDNDVGLSHVEAIREVREASADRIDLQLVAFPQNGIVTNPGTAELLDEAISMGCDLVGGLDPAGFDRDVEAHLDVVFGLAERRGVGVDIHLHDRGTLGAFEIEEIATRARALGMAGRVVISHAFALGDIDAADLARIAGLLAESGVAIMTTAPGARPFPPILPLTAAGVTVFGGNDNIRDSWWPYGDGDMLRRAMMLGYRSGFNVDEQLSLALDLVTGAGAKALGLEDYGLRVGASADFVTLNAAHGPEAVVAVPGGRRVYRAGVLVARDNAIAPGDLEARFA
ncbi:MAG: amidohydrolase family protein [Pikeienuella sp.]